jgi:coxsackievirus/adenovirus receptor
MPLLCKSGEECGIDKFGIAHCECPPQCEPIMRPVCGQDGRTYESLCELRRAACLHKKLIDVKYIGSCGKPNSVAVWGAVHAAGNIQLLVFITRTI